MDRKERLFQIHHSYPLSDEKNYYYPYTINFFLLILNFGEFYVKFE